MKRTSHLLMAALSLSLGLGFASTAGASDDAGEKTYLQNCAACHQADGKGLAGAFPPLADSDWLKGKTAKEVATTVLKGLQGEVVVNGETYNSVMPAQSHLSDAEIASTINYVLSSWGNKGGKIRAS